jgi:hypothetical protein
MGVAFLASVRPAFSAAARTLTLIVPTAAQNGDVLVVLVARNAADTRAAPPTGWTLAVGLGADADVIDAYVRMVDGSEPRSVVLSLPTVTSEWQGEILALRGTSPGILIESASSVGFAATPQLTTAGVTSQQVLSLIVVAWTCAGALGLTPPAGFTAIDSFSTAILSPLTPRSMLLGYRRAGATGALTFAPATAGASATGRSFSLVLRDRPPIQPAALVDLVPGNLGLIGKDTRPAR